jgi:membrane associated rhomboid family serine protease
MIPLKNLSPRTAFPAITLALIIANVLVFIYQITLPQRGFTLFVNTYGMIPARAQMALAGHRYTLAQGFVPLFTSMFIHGGFLHIIGNMWFLWIFGGQVEDRLGHLPYLLFYLVCGLGSGITQLVFDWGSKVPAIGASGAISGVLGAYALFFPSSRILTLIPLFIIWFTARIPAIVFIGLWFVVQFLSGIGSLGAASAGGVAWWAHIGGFLLGIFLAQGKRPKRPAYYYGA